MIVGVNVAVMSNGMSVTVGVNVCGDSEEGNSCGPFCVRRTLTVCATAVFIVPVSEIGMDGIAQAKLAINNRANDK